MNDAGEPDFVATTLEFLKDHWTILASVGYLYLIIVGMAQAGILFAEFGINIFEFAELNDFLLAAFREWLPLLSGVVLVITYIPLQILSIKRLRSGGPLTFIYKNIPLFVILAAFIYPVLLSTIPAFNKSSDVEYVVKHRKVHATLRRGSLSDLSPNDKVFSIIGTSENFVFLLGHTTERPFAVPVSNLVGLVFEFERNKKLQPTAESGG